MSSPKDPKALPPDQLGADDPASPGADVEPREQPDPRDDATTIEAPKETSSSDGPDSADGEDSTELSPAPAHTSPDGEEFEDDEDDDDDFYFPEYIGETKRRVPWVVVLTSLVSPGLGYAYMGRFLTGMLVNLIFLFATLGLLVSWALLKYFPVLPLTVFSVAWIVMLALIIFDNLATLRREKPYVLRPTNHPIVYGSVLLFTWLIPMSLVVDWSLNSVWQRTWAGSDSMYPTLTQGDLVLVDRMSFNFRNPTRGELVLIEEPGESGEIGVYFARVIGVGNDRVHMEGALPWVNGRQLEQHRRAHVDDGDKHPALGEVASRESMWTYVETPYGVEVADEGEPDRWYMITRPVRPVIEPTKRVVLDDDELFVLSDNRSAAFGKANEQIGGRVIERAWVAGRPLYILFSVEPDSGDIRWSRAGLKLQ